MQRKYIAARAEVDEMHKRRSKLRSEVEKILVDNQCTMADIDWLFYRLKEDREDFLHYLPAKEVLNRLNRDCNGHTTERTHYADHE